VTGVGGSILDGLSFSFDNGTHGTYNADTPDILTTNGGSMACLYYASGPNVAGVNFSGTFGGGSTPGKGVLFGFPFETIYDATARSNVMQKLLTFFGQPSLVTNWMLY
jgi:hypothetical protein